MDTRTDSTDEVLSKLELRIAEAECHVVVDDTVTINDVLYLSRLYDEYRGILAEVEGVAHE
jgi:hypothetical protein